MSFRVFIDPSGQKWDVWFVRPTSGERRQVERRSEKVGAAAQYRGFDRRVMPDRRVNVFRSRSHVVSGYENGWLCFECETGEKRRLVPPPSGWEELTPERLWLLCRAASHSTRRSPSN
jgi:hypothetical protein